jgi:thioredoxin 1
MVSGVKFGGMSSSKRVNMLLVIAAVAGFCLFVTFNNPAAMNKSSPNVRHITQGEFTNEVTRCSQPVVVDFYATWCEPCRVLAPLLDRVADGYTNKIKFVKVNVDESPELAQSYQVQAIPVVMMFMDGKVADQITGLPTEADLKDKLDVLAAVK